MARTAGTSPTTQELNAEALTGNVAAARVLAEMSPRSTVTAFLTAYVPEAEVAGVFDVYADAFAWAEEKAARQKVLAGLDAEAARMDRRPSNLGGDWARKGTKP